MGYTSVKQERIINLIDKKYEEFWDEIELDLSDSKENHWKKLFERIKQEFIFTSRYALYLIVEGDNAKYDMSQVMCMSSLELSELEKQLLMRLDESLDIEAKEQACNLIKLALREHLNEPLISREQAIELGHLIKLSLSQMQWFLMRVFSSVHSGFRYNESEDLIDCYVFLRDEHNVEHNVNGASPKELKILYKTEFDSIPKKDHEGEYWTLTVSESLEDEVDEWKDSPAECDNEFIKWIGRIACYLDQSSESALRIYRNLAAFFIKMKTLNLADMNQGAFRKQIYSVIREEGYIESTKDILFDNDLISKQKCEDVETEVFSKLTSLLSGGDARYYGDKAKTLRDFDVKRHSKRLTTKGVYENRSRLQELLMGEERIEKVDVIYLMWIIWANYWEIHQDKMAAEIIKARVFDYLNSCDLALEASSLPTFYLPHAMETAIILSIIKAGKESTRYYSSPASVYFTIVEELTDERQSYENSTKLKIVEEYLNNKPNATRNEIAKKYEIPVKTFEKWLTQYKKGLLNGENTSRRNRNNDK